MKNLANYLDDYFDENYEAHFKGKKIRNHQKIKFNKKRNNDEL